MAKGGPRFGHPGTGYAQRKDLVKQSIKTVPNQPYGQAGQQAAAMRAVPLPNNNQPPPPPQPIGNPGPVPAGELGQTSGAPTILPGDFGAFDRTSERPNEPVTAGLNSQPVVTPPEDHNVTALRAIYTQFPNNDLLKMINLLGQTGQ